MSEAFDDFYKDLKATEKADSTLTPKQQIDRLLRPGSTYRNLNPYEVLQVDPELPIDEIRKKYRRMSILVHPDKNQDDRERAQAAFDSLRKAFSLLEDEKTRKKCFEIVEEARGRTAMNMEEKRKKKRKEAVAKGLQPTGVNVQIEEDDPEVHKHAIHVLTMKLFADLERKRRDMENRISEEAGRKREAELKAEERKNMEKEFAKNWEETRQGRVNSWLNFTGKKPSPKPAKPQPPPPPQISTLGPSSSTLVSSTHSQQSCSGKEKKKKEKKKFNPLGFRPPKHKPETR